MNTPDLINGSFEFVGSLLIFNHCLAVLRDRAVAGVSIISTAVFTMWGFWNLYYYPHLSQWASFAGGVFIVFANVSWVMLMVHYKHGWKWLRRTLTESQ